MVVQTVVGLLISSLDRLMFTVPYSNAGDKRWTQLRLMCHSHFG